MTAIERKLPDFLMVGAAKSGTTSLYYYLKQHPQIFLPASKECWYFAFADETPPADPVFSRVPLITREDQYAGQFAAARPDQRTGECSTAYLHLWRRTIPNIRSAYEGRTLPRIVIVLRNPIDRAYSHFRFDLQEGFVHQSFEEVLAACESGTVSPFNNYLTYGRYFEQVQAYRQNFPHVEVFLSDDLAAQPSEVVRECLAFLGVDSEAPIDTKFRANVSGVPRHERLAAFVIADNPLKRMIKPLLSDAMRQRLRTAVLRRTVRNQPMSQSAATQLRGYYAEDIRALSGLLDRDFSGWLDDRGVVSQAEAR